MLQEFAFVEDHEKVILTFYKTPNDIKNNIESILNPKITLKNSRTVLFNNEEISLYSDVELSKIENVKYNTQVILKKLVPVRWNCLNGEPEKPTVNEEIYKVEKEEEKKPEDLTELFKNIYSKGDDNIKKAMNKSLEESQGTVLSTNWKDVSSKKVTPEN